MGRPVRRQLQQSREEISKMMLQTGGEGYRNILGGKDQRDVMVTGVGKGERLA